MKINVLNEMDVPVDELAKTLANSEPKEFARFWFQFNKEITGNIDNISKLDKFAKAMAPDMGGSRKKIFRELNDLIAYHEINNDRSDK